MTETLAIGIVLVTFALGWDMFTSWHVVRKHSRDFPHLTRPLLLTSYVVISAMSGFSENRAQLLVFQYPQLIEWLGKKNISNSDVYYICRNVNGSVDIIALRS